MHSNNGFSLVELMIVVGIIGILTLIGLPFYQDYVTRVKLTEQGLKHLYLSRQIEFELQSGGYDNVYSWAKGLCDEINLDTGSNLNCFAGDQLIQLNGSANGFHLGMIYKSSNVVSERWTNTESEYITQIFSFQSSEYSSRLEYSFASNKPFIGPDQNIFTIILSCPKIR